MTRISTSILPFLLMSQAVHAQVTNGDFENRTPTNAVGDCVTGDAQARFVPSPWTRIGTPDYSTERQVSFTTQFHERSTLTGFNTSPGGGCFEGFRSTEGVTQDITIADASLPLKGTFDYTEYTRPTRTSCVPNVEFRVNATSSTTGTIVGTAPNVGSPNGPTSQGSWISAETVAFTPEDFGVADGGTFSIYLGSASTCLETWGFVDDLDVILATAVIEASDNNYASTPINPSTGGTTPSVFTNDTINGSVLAASDVTASITNNGSLFGATINPDGTLDIPAGTAPGIYLVTYEICDVNDVTNCDTAVATIAVQSQTPDIYPIPNQCGLNVTQAWVTHGVLNLHDTEVVIGSGDIANDPYEYLPIDRNADGSLVSYFGAPDITTNGTISAPTGSNLSSTPNNNALHKSEINFIAYRLDGIPGSTLTADLDTSVAQEYTAYWVEDSSGNVISSSDFQFTNVDPANGGVGEFLPLSYTVPANGISYLHVAIFDPSVAFGKPVILNYACPEPSLSMDKVANNPGPYTAGDIVTYTYTVTNNGNVAIRDIAINDTHNGSDPAPLPESETLLTDVAPIGDSTDSTSDGSWDVLSPGDIITFTGTYTITQTDADNL